MLELTRGILWLIVTINCFYRIGLGNFGLQRKEETIFTA